MRDDTAEAVYRFQRFKRKGSLPGKYKGTLQVRDHLTEDVLASGDVIGDPVFAAQTVTDANLTPCRRIPRREPPSSELSL